MELGSLDYELPPELIAQEPLAERDQSRLLVLRRSTGSLTHKRFADLPELLEKGDLLVVNDARVLPGRTRGTRRATGGKVEALFLAPAGSSDPGPEVWEAMLRTRGKLREGELLDLCDGRLTVRLLPGSGKIRRLEVLSPGRLARVLEEHGEVPLPPYIARTGGDPRAVADRSRYQTVFAERGTAAAAPTAGLHFSDALIERLGSAGTGIVSLTLEVGAGTFLPIETERVEDHAMHAERYEIPEATLSRIEATRKAGGRVVAVGTTCVRALESVARTGEPCGSTRLFIRPPFDFLWVDGMVTNFHFPRSTLLLLVMALSGEELMWRAYRAAIAERYRFFSYGDAMLVLD